MKKFFFLILLILTNVTIVSSKNEFVRYSFNDVYTIQIPSSMELRNDYSNISAYIEERVKEIRIYSGLEQPLSRAVFQPSGMNSSDNIIVSEALNKYSRIILECNQSSGFNQSDIDNMSELELSILNDIIRAEYSEGINSLVTMECLSLTDEERSNITQASIKWEPIRRMKVAGRNSIVIRYVRPGLEGLVSVIEYRFYIKNQLYQIIMSYRKSEKQIWEKDFIKVIESLNFKKSS